MRKEREIECRASEVPAEHGSLQIFADNGCGIALLPDLLSKFMSLQLPLSSNHLALATTSTMDQNTRNKAAAIAAGTVAAAAYTVSVAFLAVAAQAVADEGRSDLDQARRESPRQHIMRVRQLESTRHHESRSE